jgi:Domain of unknown function (DUF4157)
VFAPKIAKPQTKATKDPTSRLALEQSMLAGHGYRRGPIEQALLLQRTIGNQATLPLLAQRASRPDREIGLESMAISSERRGLSWDFSKIPVSPPERASQAQPWLASSTAGLAGALQAKLEVGAVDDPLEHEADQVAEQVMHMPDAAAVAPPAAMGNGMVRMKRKPTGPQVSRPGLSPASSGMAVPPIVHDALRSPSQALDPTSRTFFEPRFGRSLADVRIHADPLAASSARSVGALAYTVGRDIVFGAQQYRPRTPAGNRLLAHELAHVEQQRLPQTLNRLSRQPSPEDEEEQKRHAAADPDAGAKSASPQADASPTRDANPQPDTAPATQPKDSIPNPVPNSDTPTPAVDPAALQGATPTPANPSKEDPTPAKPEATPTAPKAQPATPSTTPGGHSPAPPGLENCPDAPGRIFVVVGCVGTPAAAPPAKETAVLPTPNPAPFGGDANRALFAKRLAHCRAARIVTEVVADRYAKAVAAATKQATAEAKQDTEAAIAASAEGIDSKEKAAIAKAKAAAAVIAKKAAAQKVADAKAAVQHPDVAVVTAELEAAFERALAEDYDATIEAALRTFGWRDQMQAALDAKRKQVTASRNAKPKVRKGEQPPAPRTPEQIAAEIEADMFEYRCDRRGWALDQIEIIARAWAVGRREEVDFVTRPKGAYLKNFDPTYNPPDKDRVLVPGAPASDLQKGAGVAPEMADFLTALKADPATPPFRADNRRGHGGGSWAGKGFSVDMYLTKAPEDQRGFWRHEDAVTFLLQLDATATKLGARWRVLYNDFSVADEVNTATGNKNVGFMGDLDKSRNLNWHGPSGLKLHFHLDLEIPQKPVIPAVSTPPAPAPTKP